ncbi:LamG domain-containing protein [Bdellovibrio sp. HCB274]|uniref:LamG domain-containing protein n=1 Tax=Bdellovibrio sp. HCB274 TaxID=3394361 RepID=UPI0039B4CCA4
MKSFVVWVLLLPSFTYAQLGHQTRALVDSGTTGNSGRCVPLYRSAWLPKNTNLQMLFNFDGSGTIANGATLTGVVPGVDATATIASSTLTYSNHAAAPSPLANLRQSLSATGNANDIINAGTSAGITDMAAGTWSFWVNMAMPSGNNQRFFYKSDSNGSRGYYFILETTGQFGFIKVHATNNMQLFTCPINSTYFASSWHHIVVTWDGTSAATSAKIYMDGTELSYTGAADPRITAGCANYASYGGYNWRQAGTGTVNSDAAYPLYLTGVPASTTSNPATVAFNGKMDEFAVWNTVLSPAEVATLYKHQKCN